ncbi:DNA-binding NarL/FixJ family response regulator [Dyadobacter sp. BE34]|uniref:DNA-binding NarL/FixJ family response regulator n=1 Tax=Dyadobacter fermentans TaxID=94254 RepID=A0ABU1QTB2_9BACT|nr:MULTISPECIES: response regulator transcription factor [Dyadobacter]MDR6804323.1 DNA-binding NarL/FixJ family response regulator [Dyadobacter fermentans]MDR7042063.1 DNA-binding NarL/FixJ family response regulator [Dyadobacter sp. BE242]MDR7196466.1 DNA-binding NarL/FixJ family response regulator [Dyadobacter sp. BE34]MDR7212989.1 DNA-binding NarL/FixJ family response regulator [Dyadobacter sp. BE31]MDR7261872.1 DNA-binding NarL/FixJ family response regulator [Dyadobacter sp. BE32]
MKNILIVEDYQIIRLATKILVQDLYKTAVIREATTFNEALSELAVHPQDLVILDVQIPEGRGFEMIGAMRAVQKHVNILIFSAIEERVYGIHYLRAGANGFVSKNSETADIRTAILSIADTGRYVSPRIKVELLNQLDKQNYRADNPLLDLSAREITIMDMLIDGFWIKEIASRLDLTESSVSTYKARLFEKLHVTTLIEMFQKVSHYKDMD